MSDTLKHAQVLVGGHFTEAIEGERIKIENPGRKTIIGTVPRATAADVDSAVRTADVAFPSWRHTPPRERGALLGKIAGELLAKRDEIARTLAAESGNAIRT